MGIAHELLPDRPGVGAAVDPVIAVLVDKGFAVRCAKPHGSGDGLGVADHPDVGVLVIGRLPLPGTGLAGGVPASAEVRLPHLPQGVVQVPNLGFVEPDVGRPDGLAIDQLAVLRHFLDEVHVSAVAAGGEGGHAVGMVEHRDGVLADAELVAEVLRHHVLGDVSTAQLLAPPFGGPHVVDSGVACERQHIGCTEPQGEVEERNVQRCHRGLHERARGLARRRACVTDRPQLSLDPVRFRKLLASPAGVPVRLQRVAELQRGRQVVHLERRPGRVVTEPVGVTVLVDVPAREVRAGAILATEVGEDPAGARLYGHERCLPVLRLSLQLRRRLRLSDVRCGLSGSLRPHVNGRDNSESTVADVVPHLGAASAGGLLELLRLGELTERMHDHQAGRLVQAGRRGRVVLEGFQRVLKLVRFLAGELAHLHQTIDDVGPAALRQLERLRVRLLVLAPLGVVAGRADRVTRVRLGLLDVRHEERRLRHRDLVLFGRRLSRGLAEVRLCRRLDAVRTAAERNGVEVELEDLRLGELLGELVGDDRFPQLAGVRHVPHVEDLARVLLRDRGPTLGLLSEEVVPRRPHHADDVDTVVRPESTVLCGDRRILDRVVHLVELELGAVLAAESGHDGLAVGVVDGGRLRQLEVARCLHAVDEVGGADDPDAGEHDEDGESGNEYVAPAPFLRFARVAVTARPTPARSVSAGPTAATAPTPRVAASGTASAWPRS